MFKYVAALALATAVFAQNPADDCSQAAQCNVVGGDCSTIDDGVATYCDSWVSYCNNNTCTALLKKGDDCDVLMQNCESGLICTGTCDEPDTVTFCEDSTSVKKGEDCDADNCCGSGLYCDGGSCAEFAFEGDSCADASCYPIGLSCVEDKCVQSYSGKEGDDCASSTCGENMYCDDGTCAKADSKDGDDCDTAADCGDGDVCACTGYDQSPQCISTTSWGDCADAANDFVDCDLDSADACDDEIECLQGCLAQATYDATKFSQGKDACKRDAPTGSCTDAGSGAATLTGFAFAALLAKLALF